MNRRTGRIVSTVQESRPISAGWWAAGFGKAATGEGSLGDAQPTPTPETTGKQVGNGGKRSERKTPAHGLSSGCFCRSSKPPERPSHGTGRGPMQSGRDPGSAYRKALVRAGSLPPSCGPDCAAPVAATTSGRTAWNLGMSDDRVRQHSGPVHVNQASLTPSVSDQGRATSIEFSPPTPTPTALATGTRPVAIYRASEVGDGEVTAPRSRNRWEVRGLSPPPSRRRRR